MIQPLKFAELSAMPRLELEQYARRTAFELAALEAVLGGDRTVAQIAETVGAPVTDGLLFPLLSRDLLAMKPVDGVWHYLPVVHKDRASRRGGTR